MKKIEEYLNELESLFLEKDKEEFLEIREDILREFELKLSEGKTEDTILSELGSPKEIAQMYYTGINEDVLTRAETSVVLNEDVTSEYKMMKKAKIRKFVDHLLSIAYVLTVLFFLFIGIYTVSIFLYLLFIEKYFLFSSFLLSICCFLLLLFLKNHKKIYGFFSIAGIIGVFFLLYSDAFFYTGYNIYQTESINIEDLEDIKLEIFQKNSITVIPVENMTDSHIEINGSVQGKNFLSLSNEKTSLTVSARKNVFLYPFTQLDGVSIYLYLPKDTTVQDFSIHVNKTDTQLFDLTTKSFDISAKSGQVNLTNISSNTINVETEHAGINIKQFSSDVSVTSENSTVVLTDGNGNINANTNKGLLRIANMNSGETDIQNDSTKLIIENTILENLKITNEFGTIIVEDQVGKTTIDNISGKLVMRENSGSLFIRNLHGNIINIQESLIQGEISNEDGTIKWVQNSDYPIDFRLKNSDGTTTHLNESWSGESEIVLFDTKKSLLNLDIG